MYYSILPSPIFSPPPPLSLLPHSQWFSNLSRCCRGAVAGRQHRYKPAINAFTVEKLSRDSPGINFMYPFTLQRVIFTTSVTKHVLARDPVTDPAITGNTCIPNCGATLVSKQITRGLSRCRCGESSHTSHTATFAVLLLGFEAR